MREANASYFTHLSNANPKKFWSTVYFQSKGVTSIPVIHQENDITHSNAEKANLFNTFFISCFSPAVQPLESSDSSVCGIVNDSSLCSSEGVLRLLSNTDCSRATGPDGISGRMLASSIAASLCMLFNISLSTSTIPSEWKCASVVPVFKSGNRDSVSNYRPISLLCIVSKLLETHVHSAIYNYLCKHNLLSNVQWGFRPLHSISSSLVVSTNKWLHSIENGSSVGVVFFDLKKAFDFVPHAQTVG